MSNKRTKSPSRPRDILLHCVAAAIACAGSPSAAQAEPRELEEILSDEEERTMLKVSLALQSALDGMDGLDRSCAVCDLAADEEENLRVVAALCLGRFTDFVGGRWCLEALSSDRSPLVRKACIFARERAPEENEPKA